MTPLGEIVGFPQQILEAFMFDDIRLGDILLKTEGKILSQPNVGRKSLNQLKSLLVQPGYTLMQERETVMTPELKEFKEWRSDQSEK